MAYDPAATIYYRRSRFTTRLPVDRIYTPAHYWLIAEPQDEPTTESRESTDPKESNRPNVPTGSDGLDGPDTPDGRDVWRVGLTGFATRMLGDLVEYEFSTKPGSAITVGQTIGWLEGFKAVADLYSVAAGEFLGGNPDLTGDITLMETDPYRRGWLYRVRGPAPDGHMDVHGYVELLNATVDAMLKDRYGAGGDGAGSADSDGADSDGAGVDGAGVDGVDPGGVDPNGADADGGDADGARGSGARKGKC